MKFKTTIGLEIHVQLNTKSKMFCRCDNSSHGKKPNKNVCSRCLGMPGTLPVANRQAIEWTIKTGIALNCKINESSKFDRKHYFYPDLPKGYQISQYDQPFASRGWLEIPASPAGGRNSKSEIRKIRLNRIHLEEDAGKLIHRDGSSYSDLNRASTPLMEIVTEPDIATPKEAKKFLQELQLIVKYLGVSEASMEKGHLRCDANIDLKDESGKMSPIVELKNINSFKFIEKALKIEEKRLAKDYEKWGNYKGKLTRGYDSKKNITFLQREKEEASDYRYFPEPDIPPIVVGRGGIDLDKIKSEIKYLPDDFRKIIAPLGLRKEHVEDIVSNVVYSDFFINIVKYSDPNNDADMAVSGAISDHKPVVVLVVWDLLKKGKLNKDSLKYLTPSRLYSIMQIYRDNIISKAQIKDVILGVASTGDDVKKVIKDRGLEQVSDSGEIDSIVEKVIVNNPTEIKRYIAGEKQLFGFLMGQIMKESQGKANPKVVKEMLNKKLK